MGKIRSQDKNVLELHTNMQYWYNYLNTRTAFEFLKYLFLCEFHEKEIKLQKLYVAQRLVLLPNI